MYDKNYIPIFNRTHSFVKYIPIPSNMWSYLEKIGKKRARLAAMSQYVEYRWQHSLQWSPGRVSYTYWFLFYDVILNIEIKA